MLSFRMKRGTWILVVVIAAFGLRTVDAQSVDLLPLELHRPHVSFAPHVAKICGHLMSANHGGFTTKAPLVELKLYASAKTDKPCCKNMRLVARQTTAGDGWFDFENIPSGEYWLAVKREGKEMAATVFIDLQLEWKGNCQEQGALIGEKYFTLFTHMEQAIM
jgi:hypothetical protein